LKRFRAVLRITGVTLAVVLVIALLAIGGLWTFAQSDRGGEVIRRIAVRKVNAQIMGAVGVDRLRFGGDRLTLDGVELRDPDGAVVARVGSIDLAFSFWALLHSHVDVRRLEIRRPELRLVIDHRGSNLGRVFAPAHPAPAPAATSPAKDAGGPKVIVDLQTLAVSEGTLTVRSAVPEVHIGAIHVGGSARYDGPAAALRTDLQVVTEAGRLDAQGAVDLATMQAAASGLAVRVRGVDLAKLMRDTPASDIDVDLDAHGEHVETDLRAHAPGATVTGHGILDAHQVEARLRIEASDLAATARSLARCHLAPPVVLAGRGQIDLVMSGPRERPSLQVAGRVPQLTVVDDAVSGLVLRATIPRIDIPTAFDLDLTAASARLGGRPLHQIAAEVRASAPRHLAASVRAAVPYPVALAASGRWLSAQEIEIAALTLRYPKASWALAHPTRLGFGEGRHSMVGLDLRANDGQSVRADLEEARGAGHLRLAVSRLDLGRLPPLLPAALASAGKLDLDVDLRLSATRLRGSVAMHGLGTGLRAKLDLPATWPPRTDGRAPMQLALTVDETDLGTAAKTVAALTTKKPPVDLGGKVRLSATLDGSAEHPRLDLRFAGHALTLAGRPLGDLAVQLEGEGDRPLALKVGATAPGLPPATLEATTPLSLGALFHRRLSVAALTRTPFEINGQITEVPLALVGKLIGQPIFRAGTISVAVAAHGSAEKPVGTLAVDLKGATTPRIPATDARVELEVDQRTSKANIRIVRLGHPLLALESRFGIGLAALHERARLVEAPVYLRAVVGPLEMQRLGLPGDATGRTRESALEGSLHADLAVDGTLSAPRLEAHVQADDLRLDKTPVGYARLETRYRGGKAQVEAQIASANGGALTLEAGATADLGLPALLAGRLDPTRWPFELSVKAQKLDLRGLSGLTETLRRAAGLFDADITAQGTVRDPRFQGRAECTRCALHLAGVGDFREIHLAVHGDTDKVVIDELAAKEGDGNGRVTASLARVAEGEGYRLSGTVAVNEIPAYSDGQPLAHVSLNAALSGNSGGRGGVAEATVDVRDAHVKLVEGNRRQLQSLQTPDDVVIVDDGQPIDRAQAKKMRALAKRHTPGLPSPGTSAADAGNPPAESGAGLWRTITITVTAPHKLWVSGGGAALELGLGPEFQIVIADETRLHGEVIVRRGRIDALGRRFDIQGDSSLRFDGAPDHPTLDATAQYQDTQDNVTVLITAKGPVDHLTIGINSPNRPDLNQSQLYTLIITGHLPSSAGGSGGGGAAATASNEASSLVAGVIAGQLQKTLAKHLPLDVLTIDTGDGQGLTGTQLEAGHYVTDRLYVGYVGRIGADPTRYQNRNAVHFEYQLTARWQIAGEYGDVGTGSADLMWKKSY
jgi:translocation and assembly module TamB